MFSWFNVLLIFITTALMDYNIYLIILVSSVFGFSEHSLMQVNDAVLAGNTLVSCSSDTTVKVLFSTKFLSSSQQFSFINHFSLCMFQMWNCLSDGACTRTLRQHSDYVICLAAAGKNVIFRKILLLFLCSIIHMHAYGHTCIRNIWGMWISCLHVFVLGVLEISDPFVVSFISE